MSKAADVIRVLHVDDEPDFADMAATFVEREDDRITVETATSVNEGLESLTDDVDCIVSDYDMPGQNGIEFLKTVREEFPDLPFVLYTGKGSEEVASDAISAGVTEYLQKGTGSSQYTVLAHRIGNAVEQHRSQRAIEEAERKLSQLAEKTKDVLFMFDGDWSELLFINSAYEEIWGASASELEANPESFLDYVHPGDRDMVIQTMERLSNGKPDEIEYRVIPPSDGEQRWVRVQSSPIFDDDGNVARIVGFARNITTYKERERELERYETIVEAIDDVAFVVDDEWTVTYTNETIGEYVDVAIDALEGQSVTVLADRYIAEGYDPARFEATLTRAFAAETDFDRPERLELALELPDDEAVFEYQFSPILEDGKATAVVITMRDVTDRKEREHELERKNERLEEFASVISHDLRSPLSVAQGQLDLAREECDSERLDLVARTHDRMNVLIDDLLTLAREGEQASDVELVDLAGLTENCWRNVATAEATLDTDIERTIRADRSRLQQLLENLMRNAVEHGGTDVTVTVGESEGGFYVEDDGPGVPEKDRDDVFKAGYSTSPDGTGFGLSIVRKIAEAHGWDVQVSDNAAGETRFEITGVEFVE